MIAVAKAETCCAEWRLIINIELWKTIYVLLFLTALKLQNHNIILHFW
jgi:hypothetical protein